MICITAILHLGQVCEKFGLISGVLRQKADFSEFRWHSILCAGLKERFVLFRFLFGGAYGNHRQVNVKLLIENKLRWTFRLKPMDTYLPSYVTQKSKFCVVFYRKHS
jgi:hypothetical protein